MNKQQVEKLANQRTPLSDGSSWKVVPVDDVKDCWYVTQFDSQGRPYMGGGYVVGSDGVFHSIISDFMPEFLHQALREHYEQGRETRDIMARSRELAAQA